MSDNIKTFKVMEPSPNEEVIRILDAWLEEAKRGELQSIGLVASRVGGEYQTGFSKTDDVRATAAMLLITALRQLGFVTKSDLK